MSVQCLKKFKCVEFEEFLSGLNWQILIVEVYEYDTIGGHRL